MNKEMQLKERIDAFENEGKEWIKLFKKLNECRMDEIVALKSRLDKLEKKVLEPIAQKIVDNVQKTYEQTYPPATPIHLTLKEGFDYMFATLVSLNNVFTRDSYHSNLVNKTIQTISLRTDKGEAK